MDEGFANTSYQINKRFLKLFGGEFRILAPGGELLFYSKMKAFKLKEDIRLYTDETMQREVFRIHARKIFDLSATYDVVDATSEQPIGALRRKGFKSMLQDEWAILDTAGGEVATVREDNVLLALARRFLTNLIPQNFHVTVGGQTVGTFKSNFNPFLTRLTVDFSNDTAQLLDRRLGLAAAMMICAVEGKQD